MTKNTLPLTEDLYQYYLANSLREPQILTQLREETDKLPTARMQIAPEQGQLMSFIISLIKAKKTLDIGVYTGYSSLVVAMAIPEDGKVIGCDINSEWTMIAQKYWQLAGQQEKIELRLAPALVTLNNLLENGEENSFDFIFIDADKKNYANYYDLSYLLLKSSGVMMIDNVFWGGQVANPSNNDQDTIAIREFNKKVYEDDRVILSMIPMADGITLISKV